MSTLVPAVHAGTTSSYFYVTYATLVATAFHPAQISQGHAMNTTDWDDIRLRSLCLDAL